MRKTENGTDGYPRKRGKRIDEKGAKIWQKEEKCKKFAKSVERRSVFRYNKEKRRGNLALCAARGYPFGGRLARRGLLVLHSFCVAALWRAVGFSVGKACRSMILNS